MKLGLIKAELLEDPSYLRGEGLGPAQEDVPLLVPEVANAFDHAPGGVVRLDGGGEQPNTLHLTADDRVVTVRHGLVQLVAKPRAVNSGGPR